MRGKTKSNIISKALFDKYFYDNYKSLVVLANPKTVLNDRYAKKEIKDQVIRADQLINYLKDANRTSKIAALSLSEMEEQAKRFLDMYLEKDKDYTKKFALMMEKKEKLMNKEKKDTWLTTAGKQDMSFIKKEENSRNESKAVSDNKKDEYPKHHGEVDEKLCPKCNAGKLISRKGKFGSFLGCSNYPKCRFTVNIEKK